jgi:hypothetical protein
MARIDDESNLDWERIGEERRGLYFGRAGVRFNAAAAAYAASIAAANTAAELGAGGESASSPL